MESSPNNVSVLKIRCPSCTQKLDVTGLSPFTVFNCPACNAAITVPRRFGGILLEELVGEGHVATVYRALDPTLDREIAVKVVHARYVGNRQQSVMFLTEAKKIAALNHPRIVPIYSCGENDGQAFLVMQYMARLSLARQLHGESQPIPMELCVQTLSGVAQGLEAAFQHGILHRNVNPSNVLFDGDGTAKIADFGLACSVWDEAHDLRRNLRNCFASFACVSPEKGLTGREDVRGDIYSLGVIGYLLLTGKTPFLDEITDEAFANRLVEPVQPPHVLRDDVPEALDNLLTAMVDPVPDRRPRSYGDVLSALEGCRRAVKAKRVVSFGKGRQAVASKLAVPSRPTVAAGVSQRGNSGKSAKGRSPWLGLAIAVIVLAILGGVTLVLGGTRRADWFVRHVEPILRAVSGKQRSVRKEAESDVKATSQKFIVSDEQPLELGDVIAETPGNGTQQGEPATKGEGAQVEPDAERMTDSGSPSPGMNLRDLSWQAARPRPADLDFFRVANDLKVYLRTIPAPERETEKKRIRELSLMRGYLVSLFKFIPFDGKGRGVRLRDGKVIYGSVYGSEKELVVRPERGNYRKLDWNELAFLQYPVFFEFYIQQRMERSDPSVSPKISTVAQKREVGGDYLRLALLCDWYGVPDAAHKYARLAVERDGGLAGQVKALLPSCLNDLPP